MNNETNLDEECLLFEDRVQELLDQRISPLSDCKVAQHAARCPECTRMLQSFWVLSQSYDSRTALPIASVAKGSVVTKSHKAFHSIGDLSKIIWSFGPSFAALLFVSVAIFLSNRNNFDHELNHRIEANRHYQNVKVNGANPAADDEEIDHFFSNPVVRDVKGYSISLYQLGHATKDWTDPNGKMPQKMIKCISEPLSPIRTFVPAEVTIIVQMRHYIQVAWNLFNLSLGHENEGLRWQPVPKDWNVA